MCNIKDVMLLVPVHLLRCARLTSWVPYLVVEINRSAPD